ncbi:MAG: LysM peptidoglycan-binding domain-containing protein [Rhodospirillaceae bacterium]|nr:LysM peptidoglycan-binding domain-containing protein [Rhodospirillaceae bacterium]
MRRVVMLLALAVVMAVVLYGEIDNPSPTEPPPAPGTAVVVEQDTGAAPVPAPEAPGSQATAEPEPAVTPEEPQGEPAGETPPAEIAEAPAPAESAPDGSPPEGSSQPPEDTLAETASPAEEPEPFGGFVPPEAAEVEEPPISRPPEAAAEPVETAGRTTPPVAQPGGTAAAVVNGGEPAALPQAGPLPGPTAEPAPPPPVAAVAADLPPEMVEPAPPDPAVEAPAPTAQPALAEPSLAGAVAAPAEVEILAPVEVASAPQAVAPVPEPGPAEPAPAARQTAGGPTFDVARVDAGRNMVLAGSAPPFSEVRLVSGGVELDRVQTGASGDWVSAPAGPLRPGVHEVVVEAIDRETGAVHTGAQRLVVSIDTDGDPAGTFAVLVADDAPSVLVQRPGPAARDEGMAGGAATAPGTGPAAAPTVVAPAAPSQVAVDVIDYDAAGALVVSGRAAPASEVRIYLDNGLIGRTVTNQAGTYQVVPDGSVAPGVYAMRVDQVDAGGSVLSRVEIPFARAAQAELAAGERQVVVQPGDYLWEIARQTYGTGFRFTVIYQANRDRIGNPDLIYPGQVFVLPDIADAATAPPG